jgi:hypothetical protein
MGVVRDAIQAVRDDPNLTPEEKREQIRHIRAQAFVAANINFPVSFPVGGGLTITVVTAEFNGADLVCTLGARQGGTDLPLNNPFIFVNPPTHVPDPAGDYIKESGGIHGGSSVSIAYSEDLLKALRTIVTDAVRAQIP